MSVKRRVVVTGLGIVSPLGNDLETTWSNILQGTSGAATITKFDASDAILMEIQQNREKVATSARLCDEKLIGAVSDDATHFVGKLWA